MRFLLSLWSSTFCTTVNHKSQFFFAKCKSFSVKNSCTFTVYFYFISLKKTSVNHSAITTDRAEIWTIKFLTVCRSSRTFSSLRKITNYRNNEMMPVFPYMKTWLFALSKILMYINNNLNCTSFYLLYIIISIVYLKRCRYKQ